MEGGVDFTAIATIIAILMGPIIAVAVTRYFDDRKEARTRRMDIFRTLMRTRKMPVHQDHVGALNLVEVEFAHNPNIISAWKDYLNNLGERIPPDASIDTQNTLLKKREALLTKLIFEISRVLGFKVEQLDILEGNYIPQGWNDDDFEQRMARKALLDVLTSRRPILFQPYAPTGGHGPYPEAPKVTQADDPPTTE